ncbi:MAG: hypothetical protein KatS3mg015_0970 [Fimbriimonadales bacterium]|nr:MAG: hypothetical protein KatS3mg015_0970 [Fimbriimonadales bacterium]
MAGIQTKLPPTVVTAGSSVGSHTLSSDCIEVLLRARPSNTAGVMVNLFTSTGGVGDEPGGVTAQRLCGWIRANPCGCPRTATLP